MAARSRLGGMGVALLALTTLSPISHADEAQATGQKVTIGVSVGTMSEVQRDRSGYTADGVLVTAVDPEGAAARAGIVRGDILVVVGSVTLRSTADLDKAESKLAAGEEVSVVVARNGGRMIKVMSLVPTPQVESDEVAPPTSAPPAELDEAAKPPVPWEHPDPAPPAATKLVPPAPAAEAAPAAPADEKATVATPAPEATPAAAAAPEATSLATLGIECQDLNADLAAALGVSASTGAVVLRVKAESPAATAGIKAGDVITRLGDEPVQGVDQLGETLGRVGRSPAWRVQRQGEEREVSLAPPPPPPAPVAEAPQVETSGPSADETAVISELRTEVESLRSEVNRLRRQLARMRDREATER